MDHEMSLIMCNMGLARPGALVYDPFVGTGSILLAAALRGALTMGCDIDLKLLREGKADVHNGRVRSDGRVTVWSNFADAGLPPPLALLRADLAAPPFRGPAALGGWAHALICDPPYGVRAGGRKSGGRRPGGRPVKPVPEHLRAAHIPSTAFYPLAECMADLLDTAAHALAMRGRLVYFFPVALSEDSDDALPRHPCLELVANCRQVLSTNFARRLVTMRKVREWYPAAKAEAAAAVAEAPRADAAMRTPGVLDPRGKRSDADGNDVPPPAIAKHRGKRT
jgi:tRNA (guanine10-N2)-methyltransferase